MGGKGTYIYDEGAVYLGLRWVYQGGGAYICDEHAGLEYLRL